MAEIKKWNAKNSIVQEKCNTFQEHQFRTLTVLELDTLHCCNNCHSVKMSTCEKVTKVMAIYEMTHEQPMVGEWTADNEERLSMMKNFDIQLADTAVGSMQSWMRQQVFAARDDIFKEEWQHLKELWKQKSREMEEY